MRRVYAFEAEGVSEEVKSQLEKVEDVVEEKCTSEEACDKMLDKISDEKEKFNDALQTMADAAKDCKDGKCDKAEMAEKITPKMAELKEVAKSIGVASEGETLTEAEVKDARDYLNGVEEIVEAKKAEVCDGECEEKKDDDEKSEEGSDDDDGVEEISEESFIAEINGVAGMESFYVSSMEETVEALAAVESACYIALEGYNWDKRKEYNAKVAEIRNRVKAAKKANKAGNTDEAKKMMNDAVSDLEQFKKDFVEESKNNQGVGEVIFGYFAGCWRGFGMSLLLGLPTFGLGSMVYAVKKSIEFWVDVGQAIHKATKGELSASDFNRYTKSMEHNMDLLISMYKSAARKMGAPEKSSDANAASESFLADDSAALEAFGRNRKRTIDMDDMDVIKAYVEKNSSTMKAGDDVEAKMQEAMKKYNEYVDGEPVVYELTMHKINGIPVLITTNTNGKVADFQFSTGGKKFKSVRMNAARSAVGKDLRKADKAAAKAAKETPADESSTFTDFIDACESFKFEEKKTTPYLFG